MREEAPELVTTLGRRLDNSCPDKATLEQLAHHHGVKWTTTILPVLNKDMVKQQKKYT